MTVGAGLCSARRKVKKYTNDRRGVALLCPKKGYKLYNGRLLRDKKQKKQSLFPSTYETDTLRPKPFLYIGCLRFPFQFYPESAQYEP